MTTSTNSNTADLLSRLQHVETISRRLEPTPDEFSQMAAVVLDHCTNFLAANQSDDPAVKAFYLYDEDARWRDDNRNFNTFPERPATMVIHHDDDDVKDKLSKTQQELRVDRLVKMIDENVTRVGCNFASPLLFGYVPGGSVALGAPLGDLIAAVTNRFSGFFPASPGPAVLESSLVDWMARAIGFDQSDISNISESPSPPTTIVRGFLSSGGSMATLACFTAARDSREIFLGSDRWRRAVVYKTAEAHSCIEKALHICGLGKVKVRNVEIDPATFRMRHDKLREQMIADQAEGLLPFLVVATAGTTNTGAIDPLVEICDVVKEYNNDSNISSSSNAQRDKVWYHIDAAFGGFFALSDTKQGEFKAAFGRCDSLAADPHKSLFTAFGTAVCLVRDGDQLRKSHSGATSTAAYLNKDFVSKSAADFVDSSQLGPELSKHNRMLRIWIPLQMFGVAPYRAALEEKLLLARYLAEQLSGSDSAFLDAATGKPLFEVVPPQLSVTCFRLASESTTLQLESKLMKSGRCFLSPTTLHGRRWLRCCVLIFRTHKRHIDVLLDEVKAAMKLMKI